MFRAFNNLLNQHDEKILFETNSPISGRISVKDTYLGRELIIEGSTHSIKSSFPRANYWEYCVEYSSVKDGDRVLILGLGGGEIIRRLLLNFNVTIEVVELDPVIISIYKEYFIGFLEDKSTKVKIINWDAFDYLFEKGHKYDVIIGDVYSQNDYDVRLLEDNFLRTVKRKLNKDGQFISNRIFIFMPQQEIEHYTNLLRFYFSTVHSKHVQDNMFISKNYVFFANRS